MSAASLWRGPSVVAPRPRPVLGRPGGAAAGSRTARPALRLTRLGRLVLTAAATVVLLALAATVVTRAFAAPAEVTHTVVVPAGSTLSEIAARELPDRPIAQGVADIQRLNDLPSDQVSAGQVLLVPAA